MQIVRWLSAAGRGEADAAFAARAYEDLARIRCSRSARKGGTARSTSKTCYQ